MVQKIKFDYERGCFNCDWFRVLIYGVNTTLINAVNIALGLQ